MIIATRTGTVLANPLGGSGNSPAQAKPAALRFGVNYVQDVAYKTGDGRYQMVVEIPAGSNEKWQTNAQTGEFYLDKAHGKPRIINFVPYPFNYGFVPQTLLSKENGGDGDPLDIITLSPAVPRGTYGPVKVIGALQYQEDGETDTKVVALQPGGPFAGINSIGELMLKHPGAVEICRSFFEGYKGPGNFLFQGYMGPKAAKALIEKAHAEWKAGQ